MVNKLLLVIAMIISMATDSKNGSREVAAYCIQFNTPTRCTADDSGYCYWHYGDYFCDLRYNIPQNCQDMPNYDSCIISIGCRWNTKRLWCENLDNGDEIKRP